MASSAPVSFFVTAAETFGIYCATGGALSVVGGRPKLMKANALCVSTATAELTSLVVRYFAVGYSAGQLRVYKSAGQTFTELAVPDVQPGSLVYSVEFSPNADYLVIARNGTPGIMIYKRTGDTFTKLADPAGVPGTAAGGAKFDVSGEFLAVSRNGGMSIFRRSDDTFVLLANPADAMPSNGTASTWNSSGSILALCNYQQQPYLYSRAGAVFTKIAFPTTALPVYANGIAFSPISDLMVCVHQDAPRVSVSSVSAGVHTRHADPAVLPGSQAQAVAFNPTGDLVVVGAQDGLYIYTVSGTTLTRISNPVGSPDNVVNAAFNHDGTIMTLGIVAAPYLVTYAVSGTTFTEITNPPSIVPQSVRAADFSN